MGARAPLFFLYSYVDDFYGYPIMSYTFGAFFTSPEDEILKTEPDSYSADNWEQHGDIPAKTTALPADELTTDGNQSELMAGDKGGVQKLPTIEEVAEQGNFSIGRTISEITEMSSEITETITASMGEQIASVTSNVNDIQSKLIGGAKDYFFDQSGIKHDKLPETEIGEVSSIVKAVDGIFGKLCVDGVRDSGFDLASLLGFFKGLLGNGMFSFSNCLFERAKELGYGEAIQAGLVGIAKDLAADGKVEALAWAKDKMGGFAGGLDLDALTSTALGAVKTAKSFNASKSQTEYNSLSSALDNFNDGWKTVSALGDTAVSLNPFNALANNDDEGIATIVQDSEWVRPVNFAKLSRQKSDAERLRQDFPFIK